MTSRELGGAKEHVAGKLSMRVLVSGTETQCKEATMVLNNYKVGAGLAGSDMDRAREFYEGKLGLSVSTDSANNIQYRCAEDSVLHIYRAPELLTRSLIHPTSWKGNSANYFAVTQFSEVYRSSLSPLSRSRASRRADVRGSLLSS